uniref:Reverse transcriptase domain-containing protein n=1 Tax=Nippostrongylus brasiliensis TaxID=27835 RepID=A0A0N4YT47_NIPBR
LDDVIKSVPDDDFLTIAGDQNGHVGTGRRVLEKAHGGRGFGAKNEDGERIPDLAVAQDLEICSTFFAKRESQKMNYCSGGHRTEVDHILVRREDLKAVKDVKVLPGEVVARQHRSLVADLSVLLPPKMKERTEPKIRWWKLKGPVKSELKRNLLATGLPNPDGPVNETWRQAAQTILHYEDPTNQLRFKRVVVNSSVTDEEVPGWATTTFRVEWFRILRLAPKYRR